MIQPVNNSTITNKPNFMAKSKKAMQALKEIEAYVDKDTILTPTAMKQVKKLDEAIDLTWQRIRKNKENITPKFEYTDKGRGIKVSLTPIYRSFFNEALLEINSPNSIEKILVRRDGTHFRYERAIKTDHGYMTGKAFDSTVDKNPEFTQLVSNQIETYIPKLIKTTDLEKLRTSLFKSV